jgi:diguanylate cyclase (GGDEF)-like protein/PAS domain S-box-containing protein
MRGLFRKENWHRIRRFAPVLIVGIVGVTASIAFWYLTMTSEDLAFVQEFSGRANNQAIILQDGIDDYWDKLYAVRALFDASGQPVTREEFEKFSNSLIEGHTAILNIAWLPRVKREERVAHELAATRDGLPDYHIRAASPDGSLAVAPERDEYLPKFYSTEARTSRIYGFDLNDPGIEASDGGTRERTLDHIRDGNVLSASPPTMLYIGNGDRRGFWAGLPVYARGLPHETVEERRRNLLGVVQGVFQIKVMIDSALSGVKSPVRLYLFPPHAAAADLPIYFTSRFGGGPIEAKSQAELAEGLNRSFPINFGDVAWKLVAVPESAGFMSTGHERSSLVLMSGLLLSGALTSLIWAMRRDADKLKTAKDKFEEQNLRFDAALNNMASGLLMYDRAGKLVTSNRRFAELFGVPWEKWEFAALGTTIANAMQLVHDLTKVTEKNRTQIMAELQSILERGRTGTIVFERTNGRTFSAACAPMTDGGFVITFEDITERRRTEDQISHMAHYDALTDLPNRVLFYEKMEALLRRASPSGRFAVFSLDLDHFKSVNDTLGHPIGDKLLQAVVERMRGAIRERDIVARLGGDEFAVVQVPFEQPADATSLATRLIEAVGAPYQLDSHQVVVKTSIGIAIAPADGSHPDQLMKNADLALYRSKADGGSMYRFFEPQMDARMQERRALELDLRKALVNGEFTLNYQPIVNLKTGKVTSCEALICWHQPERGWVPPSDFIPIAEETGLIGPIGEWILRRACADAAAWPREFSVAVNVSPGQFKIANFAQVVATALERSRLPASRLELEITELVLMQDIGAAVVLLHQLKDLGVSIAMDDFGTGYSSLGYLRRFPFDKIKIDKTFIRDLSNNKDSLAILRAVVGLGRGLGIVTTAEGVETQNQLEVLRAEGCTEAQGYFFSQPRSATEARELLTSLDTQTKAIA